MDKYELVLDVIEHPYNYTSEQLAEILSDPETRAIYKLLCKTDSAIEAGRETDVDSEWENFSEEHAVCPNRLFFWFGSRAASIAAMIGTAIAAVAAGIAVTVAVIDRKPMPSVDEIAVVQINKSMDTDALTANNDSVEVVLKPVMFEDEPLEKIMKEVSEAYGVEVGFSSKDAASLHLYYKFDPSLPLDEVVEQLNTFERISIRRNGNVLNID